MLNLMITHNGAIGDNLFTLPALRELKNRYEKIYLSCAPQGKTALDGCGVIDKFIVKDTEYGKLSLQERAIWLLEQTKDIDFNNRLNFHGVIPARLMYHSEDKEHAGLTQQEKIDRARGKNFFDEMSIRAATPGAIGKRPDLGITEKEQLLLEAYKKAYLQDNFVIGWQWHGSGSHKMYPFFNEVIQYNVLHWRDTVCLGFGDVGGKIKWDEWYHRGKFINITGSTFRWSLLLSSLCNVLISPETGIFVGAQAFPHVVKILLATHTTGEHICCGSENIILHPTCACAPCYIIAPTGCELHPELKIPICITTIQPALVIETIYNVYKQRYNTSQAQGLFL